MTMSIGRVLARLPLVAGLTVATAADAGWTTIAPTVEKHTAPSSTLRADGRVMIAERGTLGVGQMTVETHGYGGGWSAEVAPIGGRTAHSATRLPSGEFVFMGGIDVDPTMVSVTGTIYLYSPRTDTWTEAAAQIEPRYGHTATVLSTGAVLVVGGLRNFCVFGCPPDVVVEEVQLYARGVRLEAAPLLPARTLATATVLPDGRVLVAGGLTDDDEVLDDCQLYDPVADTWLGVAPLKQARVSHSATLLADGTVLVAGGADPGSVLLSSAELYDPPPLDRWRGALDPDGPQGFLEARAAHSATLLPDGSLLIAGGEGDAGTLASAERYDPATRAFSAAGALADPRSWHSATLLPGGRVVVTGDQSQLKSAEMYTPDDVAAWHEVASPILGSPESLTLVLEDGRPQVLAVCGGGDTLDTELYDPAADRWERTGDLNFPCRDSMFFGRPRTALLLPGGKVLLAGHGREELYDPGAGTWSPAPPIPTPRLGEHTTTLLADGRVLVVGGNGPGWPNVVPTLDAVEILDPATETWSAAAPLPFGRARHAATLLHDGRVLVSGGAFENGLSGRGIDSRSLIYDPGVDQWTEIDTLNATRDGHSAALLPDGRVLLVGGDDDGTTETFDPVTERWSPAPNVGTNFAGDLVVLPDGRALEFDRHAGAIEVFDPIVDTWTQLPVAPVEGRTVLLPDGRVLAVDGTAAALDWGGFPATRRPLLTSTPGLIRYGERLTIAGRGLRGDSEATSGHHRGSAVDYPLIQLRNVTSQRLAWLRPDPLDTLWADPLEIDVSQLPTLDVGWHLLTVFGAGVPSVSAMVEVVCSLAVAPPADQTAWLGEVATFVVAAEGARGFQWQRFDGSRWVDIPGSVGSAYTTPPASGADAGSRYRAVVTGACETAVSAEAVLTVSEGAPPVVTVRAPSGGEYWLLEPGSTQVVSWTMSDDLPICRVAVSLRYSNDGGASWFAADDPTTGLPASFGPGGPCAFPGETTASLVYTMPADFPSGRAGSLYEVEVVVTDHAGNENLPARSARPFYIVQPNPSSVRTLIVYHIERMERLDGVDGTALRGKLEELADHPRVQGFIVDLAAGTDLAALYDAWDASPSDPALANAVLFSPGGIHSTLRGLLAAFTGVESLVLVGDDRILPFARVPDGGQLFPERNYTASGADLTATGTTVGQAISADFFLSDDPLALLQPVAADELVTSVLVPELAVGRLVETPDEIIHTIATFISVDGM